MREPVETPFPIEDVFEKDAVYRLSLMNLRLQCESVQVQGANKDLQGASRLTLSPCRMSTKELSLTQKSPERSGDFRLL